MFCNDKELINEYIKIANDNFKNNLPFNQFYNNVKFKELTFNNIKFYIYYDTKIYDNLYSIYET